MKNFFSPNIGPLGRIVRASGGAALVICGLIAGRYNPWVCVAVVAGGGFMLFEAVRGWCLMRACGVKTKL